VLTLWRWLMGLWKARQREIDAQILWPSLREQASTLDQARAAFRVHMEMDPAYSDMTAEQRDRYVEELPS
jgi:hypothetical protein